MEIKITYKGINKDSISGIWCGFKPDDITVKEKISILYPKTGYLLKNKITNETVSSVVLTSDVNQDDYTEVIDEEYENIVKEMEEKADSLE